VSHLVNFVSKEFHRVNFHGTEAKLIQMARVLIRTGKGVLYEQGHYQTSNCRPRTRLHLGRADKEDDAAVARGKRMAWRLNTVVK